MHRKFSIVSQKIEQSILVFRKIDAEKIFAEAAAQNMTGLGYAWIVTEQVSLWGSGQCWNLEQFLLL